MLHHLKIMATVLLLFAGSRGQAQAITQSQADSAAHSIISHMTFRQKLYEMHGHNLAAFGLSMVFAKKQNPVKAGGNKKLHIPVTIFIDGPRGINHYRGATAFPTTMARGASWDVALERRLGDAMAEEIRAVGGNYSGAVCMNLLRHPAWGRSEETYGEDPQHVGAMARALIDGIQQNNVQACAKHFAANSMENNRFGGNMVMDRRTLYEVYLPHFRRVVEHGVASIMSAYNQLNGEYCGHSAALLTDILRTDWGFRGYVTSDWLYGLRHTEKGIKAGMNIEMPGAVYYKAAKVKKLLRHGTITGQQIDTLIFPIIRTKLLFASRPDTKVYTKSMIGSKAHSDLAREVAEKSAVLLKNENNTLPLDQSRIKRIAVIGAICDLRQTGDHGSSNVNPAYIVSPLEGIRRYASSTKIEVLTAPAHDTAAIRAICTRADIVIMIAGNTYLDEGEYIGQGKMRDRNNPDKKSAATRTGILGLGGDRKYLHLHEADIDLIHLAHAANAHLIVSMIAGSAVTVEEWHEEAQAIMETFYNGQEGGNALARLLFGEVSPSGKLSFTVPRLESDLPPFDSYAANVNYGYYHGYSLFDKEKKTARYPFGYGLSYTSFQMSDMQIAQAVIGQSDTLHVSVKVKNTGSREGAEVAQLYVHFTQSKIDRPVKLLRAFQKVYLQPGEERTVQFMVPAADLAYYNPDSNKWEIERMDYRISVANSSALIGALQQVVTVR